MEGFLAYPSKDADLWCEGARVNLPLGMGRLGIEAWF